MNIVLSPNPYRDKGLRTAQAAGKILRNAGVDTCMCLPFSVEGGSIELPKGITFHRMEDALKKADILVCFGGDGTILHAAKDANHYGVPILGVNLGSVGFMAELEQGELSLLSKLAVGKYTVEPRMMLDVVVRRDNKIIFSDMALNDAVITKGAVARVVDLEVLSDKTLITSFAGDGVIISTPTGSTAYSMSAGGPIVEPASRCIIITPVCAHKLAARSLVLDQDRVVTVRLPRGSGKHLYLSVDGGKALRLSGGDRVEVRRSAHTTKLVMLSERSFYQVINQKLGGDAL